MLVAKEIWLLVGEPCREWLADTDALILPLNTLFGGASAYFLERGGGISFPDVLYF